MRGKLPRRTGGRDLKRIFFLALAATVLYVARPKQMEDLAEDAREAVSEGVERLRKDDLERALEQFESLRGRKPADLEELVREGLVDKTELVDEWGRSLRVEVTTQGIVVRSAGRDGRFGTRDDWTLGES